MIIVNRILSSFPRLADLCSIPISPLIFFSTSKLRKSPLQLPFITGYLIDSIGFSPEDAIAASKPIYHIQNSAKPDAVLHFLKSIGLDEAGIRNAVSRKPILLCTQVEKTLKPKVGSLHQAGFSQLEIAKLISENPFFIHRKDVNVRIEYLRDLFASKEDLLKAIIKNTYLLCSNLDKSIIPNVAYLRTCGLSKEQVAYLMKYNHRLITRRLDSIKNAVQRAVELGFCPSSKMFHFALHSTCRMSSITIDAKVKAMMSVGWSEVQISSAILKAPQVLFLSVENIKRKADFFVEKVGCELSYLISHPRLLCHSFEKRLVPRNHVLKLLDSKGLRSRKRGLFYCMIVSNQMFVEKFVLPYEKELPDLKQTYLSECEGAIIVEGRLSC